MDNLVKQYEELEKNANAAKEKIAYLEKQLAFGQSSFVGSDEKRLLRVFGCNTVEKLLQTNVGEPKYAGASISDRLAVIELKKELDIARWHAQIFSGMPLDQGEMDKEKCFSRCKGLLDTSYAKEVNLADRIKAFGTGVTGGGAEWIETMVSANYIDEYMLEKKVVDAFQEIPMPSNPFKMTVKKDGTTAKIVAEGGTATGSNFGTDALTFDAANKLVELYELPEELNEDSAPAFLAIGRASVLDSQFRALESAVINGDTSVTHMDSNVTAASDCRKAWTGLRKLALNNSANNSVIDFAGAVSATKIDDMIIAGGKFTHNPREVLIIASPSLWHQITMLSEVSTVDKLGGLATMLTGYLAAFRGKPIVQSEYLFENLNASGVYDGVTTTKGALLIVNKTRFYMGRRRPIRIRVAMDSRAEYDRWQLASYQRADFKGHTQSATEKSVIYGINITI